MLGLYMIQCIGIVPEPCQNHTGSIQLIVRSPDKWWHRNCTEVSFSDEPKVGGTGRQGRREDRPPNFDTVSWVNLKWCKNWALKLGGWSSRPPCPPVPPTSGLSFSVVFMPNHVFLTPTSFYHFLNIRSWKKGMWYIGNKSWAVCCKTQL